MMRTSTIILYGIGALLMALPGLFTTGRRSVYLLCMISGLLLIAAAGKRGFAQPKTALVLLVVSNISFWLSVVLWLSRDKLFGMPTRESGVDPFVGPLLLWLAVLILFVIYESVVFATGIIVNRSRTVAVIGLAAVAVQVLLTGRSIYLMIQGV